MSDPLLQLLSAALVPLIPIGIGLVLPIDRRDRLAVLASGVVGGAALLLSAASGGLLADPSARLLDSVLAASVTAVVAMLAVARLGRLGGAVFAAGYGAVIGPAALSAVLGEYPSIVSTVLGAIDYAGVVATHVAPASALLVVALLPARSAPPVSRGASLHRSALGAALVTVGALAWLVGVERVVDEASGRILANGAVGILLATTAWIVMERIRWARFTPEGLVVGVVAGWAVIGIGAPFLAPVALVATAVLGGLAAGAARGDHRRSGAGVGPGASLAVIVAALVGGVVTSLLADGFGLAATGTLVLTAGQIGAVMGVGLASAALAVPCWVLAVVVREAAVRWAARRRWDSARVGQ